MGQLATATRNMLYAIFLGYMQKIKSDYSTQNGLSIVDPMFLDFPDGGDSIPPMCASKARRQSPVVVSSVKPTSLLSASAELSGSAVFAKLCEEELELKRTRFRMQVMCEVCLSARMLNDMWLGHELQQHRADQKVRPQVRSKTTSSDAAKRAMAAVEWMRLVQSLFQDILGLALQAYIIVLVRQQDFVRFASAWLATFSMAINVALMFGEKQPCAPPLHDTSSLSWCLGCECDVRVAVGSSRVTDCTVLQRLPVCCASKCRLAANSTVRLNSPLHLPYPRGHRKRPERAACF